MTVKGPTKGLPTNIPDLEEDFHICLLTKANKITRVTSINVSKFPPGFMLQMDFDFFNVESIHGFTSDFVDLCSATSYPFVFPPRIKDTPLNILKFLVTTLRNQ